MEYNSTLKRDYTELKERYSKLMSIYLETKQAVLDSTWAIVEIDGSFVEIRSEDKDAVETETRIGEYSIYDTLGVGQFSVVKAARKGERRVWLRGVPHRKRRDTLNDDTLAVKIICKETMITIKNIYAIENEISVLRKVGKNKNVVGYVDMIHGPRHLYIFMERIKSDLFKYMEENKEKMDTNVVGIITKEILSGVAHLTQHRVVHRDIKPENVLIAITTNDIVVKLCDFGHSRQMGKGETKLCDDFAGSPGFYAPEAILTKSYDAFKADVYSVACVTLEMLVSTEFFSNVWMTPFQSCMIEKAKTGKQDFHLEMRNAILAAQKEVQTLCNAPGGGAVSEFVCSILHMQPELRPSVMSLLSTPWLSTLNRASACDKLLEREHLHVQYRRFSYVPPGLDGCTTTYKAPLLSRGVKIPEYDKSGSTNLPRVGEDRRRSSTATFRQLVPTATSATSGTASERQESRRLSSIHMKDNGLGAMNVNSAEVRRQAKERRASFLTVQSEDKNSAFTKALSAARNAQHHLAAATGRADTLAQTIQVNMSVFSSQKGIKKKEEEEEKEERWVVGMDLDQKEEAKEDDDRTDDEERGQDPYACGQQHTPFSDMHSSGLQFFMDEEEEEVFTDKEEFSPMSSAPPSAPHSAPISRKSSFSGGYQGKHGSLLSPGSSLIPELDLA